MRKLLIPVFCTLFVNSWLFAQNVEWKAGINYFFDNTEYAKSTLTNDQTMAGVHFSPEVGLGWGEQHHIFVGADVLKISGSANVIDIAQPIAYYHFEKKNSSFYAGGFPRSELLSNYSDLFFQDSINNYRPTLQGIFWQAGSRTSYFNLWLDWTGHETPEIRESFFVGASAHKSLNLFFVDFQSYMFHYANTQPRNPLYSVNDNLLAHISVGANYSNETGIDTLLFAVGVLGGYERDRKVENGTHFPVGAVVRLNADYKGFGTQNTLYAGDPRDIYYYKYNHEMYWNNPFLRAGFYLQSKWYLNVIRSKYVDGKLGLNLHFSEGKMMYEQTFTLKAKIDNLYKQAKNPRPTFMSKWFE